MTDPRLSVSDDLWSLVEAMVTGTATPAERDRLEAYLRADPQARLFYVTYLDVHSQLQWRTRGESAPAIRRRDFPIRPSERGRIGKSVLRHRSVARWVV